MTTMFTFGTGHECICGRPLDNCYTKLDDSEQYDARGLMFRHWGTKWSHEYPAEKEAEFVQAWASEYVPTNLTDASKCPCGSRMLCAAGHEDALQYERWVASLEEPAIQLAARRWPLLWCYRSTENPGWHFLIDNFALEPDGRVTCMLIHGSDSTSPGVGTFGQNPEQLILCRCGLWKPPTQEQIAATRARIEAQFGPLKGGDCEGCGCGDTHD